MNRYIAVAAVAVFLIGGAVAFAFRGGGDHASAVGSVATGAGTSSVVTGPAATSSGSSTSTSPSTSLPVVVGPESGPPDGHVPSGFLPQSVSFVSSQTGWVLGWAPCSSSPCTSVVRTRDGGRTWHGIPAPRLGLAGRNREDGLRFADLEDGWVFGGALFATHDGGARWRPVSLPGLGRSARVVDLEASDGAAYALAAPVRPDGLLGMERLYRTDANRDDWVPVTGIAIPHALAGTLVLHGRAGWLLGTVQGQEGGRYYATVDGRTWARRPWPCSGEGGAALAASSASSLFLVCGDGAAAGSQRKLAFFSGDGGRSFQRVHSLPLSGDLVGAVVAPGPAPTTAVVAALSGASFIYATFDGGSHWEIALQRFDGGLGWYDLGFTTALQGVVIDGRPIARPRGRDRSQLFMTRDGGHTWTRVRFGAS